MELDRCLHQLEEQEATGNGEAEEEGYSAGEGDSDELDKGEGGEA